jgi:phospholipase C
METRRDFMKAALLAGAAGLAGGLSDSIQRAFAIAPDEGTTFWDAEHVVILMQENRSFDHAFGTLQGVRGFNDPRAIKLANGSPVWVQTNKAGESYLPFRLDINKTSATWMGCIPHNWTDQVDARNGGLYDGWLDAKRSGNSHYADMPLTMGYYTREDIPFYYDLADAFTICDQNFCSSLTGTTPNRLHLWTGTIRPEQSAAAPAMVLNSDVDYPTLASWTTFPERLEDAKVSWKVYQNELYVGVGFQGEEEPWLANFGDNPLEYFSQYHVNLAAARCRHLQKIANDLAAEVERLKNSANAELSDDGNKLAEEIQHKEAELVKARAACREWNTEKFEQLSPREQNLHNKAFDTNCDDPDYHTLTVLKYQDAQTDRQVQVPKGDVLYQFRKDVAEGKLPLVSWVVPPERFSDHPCSAWYGAWYIAEMLDILTANPKVWKKTIFILTYDENDGYFDHVPPFVAPHPRRPETGKASVGIDVELEYVEREQELKRKPAHECRDSPIGLGYRVPMIIASPWTRGGCVCSQVFDHTSSLQFLEKFLTRKTGTPITETNVNSWRRAVCGDLTSVFQQASAAKANKIVHPTRDQFIEQIHRAQFMNVPTDYRRLSSDEIQRIRQNRGDESLLPRQESGVRKSCPLPYELAAEGQLATDRESFAIRLESRNQKFGEESAGAPFIVYSRHGANDLRVRNYTVAAGGRIDDSWPLTDFADSRYDFVVYGPNGFFREFRGDKNDPLIDVQLKDVGSEREFPAVAVQLQNQSGKVQEIEIADLTYGTGKQTIRLSPGESKTHVIPCERSFGWYDVEVHIAGSEQLKKHYAGRVETGAWSYTDPAMGKTVAQGA